MDRKVEIDYVQAQMAVGDLLVLATDGVYEYTDAAFVQAAIAAGPDLDAAARAIAEEALQRGSGDNLTVQLIRIDELPDPEANEVFRQISDLPCPPQLEARDEFEGYQIVRVIKRSARSHIYLAVDKESGERHETSSGPMMVSRRRSGQLSRGVTPGAAPVHGGGLERRPIVDGSGGAPLPRRLPKSGAKGNVHSAC